MLLVNVMRHFVFLYINGIISALCCHPWILTAFDTMTVGLLMRKFADGTTMHGVPKAIRACSGVGRMFWSAICLLAGAMFCVNFTHLLIRYYSHPKKVTIEVVPLPIPFPSISLCNMRSLDYIILNKLNRAFKENDQALWANISTDPFISSYMAFVTKYYPMYQNMSMLEPQIFSIVLTRSTMASNIRTSVLAKAGVPFDEFVVTCRFGGHDCNRTRDFDHFFDAYYYNCFTYTSPPSHDPDSTLAEGMENGWTTIVLSGGGMITRNEEVRIIPGTHEWFSPMASSEGVRVLIHPPHTQPFPHAEGFDVPPGFSASFAVKPRQNIRIGPPHGNCTNSNPFGDDNGQYRSLSCQKKCTQEAIIKNCGCQDISLPRLTGNYSDVVFCADDTNISSNCSASATPDCFDGLKSVHAKIICVRNIKAKMAKNATAMLECDCYPACQETLYDVTYSLSKWPAQGFEGEAAYVDIFDVHRYPHRFDNNTEEKDRFDFFVKYFSWENRWKAMQDFIRLNVYIADSNVLKTEESEGYSTTQLLSDIGGQLGLWIGVSVITITEILELCAQLVRYVFTQHGPYSTGQDMTNQQDDKKAQTYKLNGYMHSQRTSRELEEQVLHMV